MPLTLEQYDREVGHHLRMIRHHAMSIETHVGYMTHRPDFETIAEEAMAHVVATLESALRHAENALARFKEKPTDA